MEPKLPMPNPSPERGPIIHGNPVEYKGSSIGTEIVNGVAQPERTVEEAREQLSGVGVGDANVPQSVSPSAPSQQSDPVQSSTMSSTDDTPLVAADEDLIEREWVDKAKQIVTSTRDDPYAQEREVSRLQANYLQKRYGKEIKLSNH